MDYADSADGKRNDTRNKSSSTRTGRMIAVICQKNQEDQPPGSGYAGLAE